MQIRRRIFSNNIPFIIFIQCIIFAAFFAVALAAEYPAYPRPAYPETAYPKSDYPAYPKSYDVTFSSNP